MTTDRPRAANFIAGEAIHAYFHEKMAEWAARDDQRCYFNGHEAAQHALDALVEAGYLAIDDNPVSKDGTAFNFDPWLRVRPLEACGRPTQYVEQPA